MNPSASTCPLKRSLQNTDGKLGGSKTLGLSQIVTCVFYKKTKATLRNIHSQHRGRPSASIFETIFRGHVAASDPRPPDGHKNGTAEVIPDCWASPLSPQFRGHIAALDRAPGKSRNWNTPNTPPNYEHLTLQSIGNSLPSFQNILLDTATHKLCRPIQ